jgi:glycosyltransferase involved in cell wall biosynthesis
MAPSATVSVVIPTYRRPDCLKQAIASVLAQDYGDWELTVRDDGGTPENREVVESFGDRRIAHHPNAVRLGVGANKLAGWRSTQGEYFANLDDDDSWEPNFLSTLVAPLQADPSVAIAFGSQTILDEDGVVDDELTRVTEENYRGALTPGRHWPIAEMMLVDHSVPVATGSLIRSSAIDWSSLPASENILVDYWLGYLIVKSGGGAFFHKAPLARYRVHSASASATAGVEWHTSLAECYRQIAGDTSMAAIAPIIRERLFTAETRAARQQLAEGDMRGARASSRRLLGLALTPTTIGLAAAAYSGRLGRRAMSGRAEHFDTSLAHLRSSSPPPR